VRRAPAVANARCDGLKARRGTPYYLHGSALRSLPPPQSAADRADDLAIGLGIGRLDTTMPRFRQRRQLSYSVESSQLFLSCRFDCLGPRAACSFPKSDRVDASS